MRLGRPEASRESEKLARGELLPAEHEHLAGEERLFDFAESGIGKRPSEVDAARFHGKIPAQSFQLHRCAGSKRQSAFAPEALTMGS
jgi:hypothetical protein